MWDCALPYIDYVYEHPHRVRHILMSAHPDTKQYPVSHTEAEWRKILSPEQYHIMREHGTERPGSCALNYEKRAGTFFCAGCGQKLFASKTKFESGTGWPSLTIPSPVPSKARLMTVTAWSAPRCIAAAAAVISAMCLKTVRRRPICAIASTAWR